MLKEKFEQRLYQWKKFRESLETDDDPISTCIDFCNNLEYDRLWIDPYDKDQWPGPWDLLHQNLYCNLSKLLFFCYTFQLTDRFSQSSFEIHIGISQQQSAHHFVLFIDKTPIGYYNDIMCVLENLNDLETELCVAMPAVY